MRADVIRTIESAYGGPDDRAAWVEALADEFATLVDTELGLLALLTDSGASRPSAPAILHGAMRNLGDDLVFLSQHLSQVASQDDVRSRFFRSGSVTSLRRVLGKTWDDALAETGTASKVRDGIYIQAGEYTGHVVSIVVPTRERVTLAPHRRYALERIAAHLGAACRLREKEGRIATTDGADAVFAPSGKLLHAEREAADKAFLSDLRKSAMTMDLARGPLRDTDPEKAAAIWRALVAGQWTLLESFDTDGKRFVVARRNEPRPVPLAQLSRREAQIAILVAGGRADKLIAYELGISRAAVAVHVARIKSKLGAATRAELVKIVLANMPELSS